MEPRTTLERVMCDALLRNNLFFDEQVYVKTDHSFYLYDFVVYGDLCKVVVECDGLQHEVPSHQFHDSRRDLWTILNEATSVLRFKTFEIYGDVEECIDRIKNEINTLDACLIDDDGTRRRRIDEEKEGVRNKKTSYFYKNRSTAGFMMNQRVEIPQKSSAEIHQKEKFQLMDERPSLYWSQNSFRVDSRIRGLSRDSIPWTSKSELNKTKKNLERKKKIVIPEEEMKYENLMKTLPTHEMNLLFTMIKGTTKDGFYVFRGSMESIQNLCSKGLLEINPLFHSRKQEISVRVLPNAPNLLKNYFKENISTNYLEGTNPKGTTNTYQKCSVIGCIAKIPTSKVVEWNGRCPRHKNY